MTRAPQEQQAAAEALVGKTVHFAHQSDEAAYRVTAAVDGLVELQGLVGLFAPHLFIVLGR